MSNRLATFEHSLAVTETLLSNCMFALKNKLGLLDHSIGTYGPRGMPGLRGLPGPDGEPETTEDLLGYMENRNSALRRQIQELEKIVKDLEWNKQ